MANSIINNDGSGGNGFLRWLGRLALVIVVLWIASFLTPGFSIRGTWGYVLAALVISVLDYAVEAFMGVDASPLGKGAKGFIIAAVIIYLAQFVVPNMNVSIIGALLAALVIGILDSVFPVKVM